VKVVAIIQARMGSTRLPGKVLRILGGSTVLAHVVCRVQAVPGIHESVVATTQLPRDDAVVAEALRFGASVFRGSEEDVLSRYCRAAERAQANVVVRATSDCPLLDSDVLAAMLTRFQELHRGRAPVDYLSNTLARTYPRGLDVEIFSFAALTRADREARGPAEREHVTPFIYRHPELFRVAQFRGEMDLSAHRWTLDTEEDWTLLEGIFRRADIHSGRLQTAEVLKILARDPVLAAANAAVMQKAVGH
jgi:spore coat polysaccharide biosynthesis protein SpsF